MNIEQFLELADRIIQIEKRGLVQQKLDELTSNLSNLSSSPGNDSYQKAVSTSVNELRSGYNIFDKNLTPRQKKMIDELTDDIFFDPTTVDTIVNNLSENAISPSVSIPFVQSVSSSRSVFLSNLEAARTSLKSFGFDATSIEPNETEIGFLVPREIFNNSLDGFIKEANVIKFILDTANIAATGSASDIPSEQLSTSDPYLIFGLDPTAAVMMAGVITWGLNTWKQTLEIRELKEKAREIPALQEIADQFEGKVKDILLESIKSEVGSIIKAAKKPSAELESRIERMLELVLQRFERGYNIDLRLPPPIKDAEETQEINELRALRSSLAFPEVKNPPVLQLTTQTEAKRGKQP